MNIIRNVVKIVLYYVVLFGLYKLVSFEAMIIFGFAALIVSVEYKYEDK